MSDNNMTSIWRRPALHSSVRVFICTTVFVSSHGLRAQQLKPPLPDSASLATITTDTGAFAVGHRDFSRYTVPGMCRAAAANARASFQDGEVVEARTLARYLSDSTQIRFAGEQDTVGAGETAVVARTCGASLTLTRTTAHDLYDVFLLALYAQNDALALTLLSQLVAHAPTEQARQHTWKDGYTTMLMLGHRMAAQGLMTRFDTGHPPPSTRYLQVELLESLRDQDSLDDTGHLRQETDREIEAARTVNDSTSTYFAMMHAYRTLMGMAVERYPADSIAVIARRAQRDLGSFPSDIQRSPWLHVPLDSVVNWLAPEWYTRMMAETHLHHRAPRLQADYWFPAPGSAHEDTLRPVPGKVNVLCLNTMQTPFRADVVERGGPWANAAVFAHDRRWIQKYQTAGVVFTIVERAYGYGGTYGVTDANGVDVLTPADEAQRYDWTWHTYQRLPVALAVQTAQSDWLPSPDGRRMHMSSIQFEDFVNWYSNDWSRGQDKTQMNGACAVIGRDGEILYERDTFTGNQDMRHLEAVLDWILRAQATSSVAHGSQP